MHLEAANFEDSLPEFRITDFPLHYLTFVLRQAQTSLTRALRPYGLTNQGWRVLAALSVEDDQSIRQIADVTVIDRSNLGRVLDDMERAGLVRRTVDNDDRRAVRVRMTKAGRASFADARPVVLAVHDRLTDGIDADDQSALMAMLRQMKANSVHLEVDF